ncbi:hypothetical protein [Paraclostridium sordellii]|uniref:hypothetical protein n=1 Tax=Paraclostridium sordellii TaxID=1505 RepID=UPI0013154823|nr:hypothetical protein [Paeniclostridium sordellii]MDU5021213.1 hypothetical protein [Clostridiales bacterium]
MVKIGINKLEFKKRVSYFVIKQLKDAIIIIALGLILTPITLWLMECFVNHFFG